MCLCARVCALVLLQLLQGDSRREADSLPAALLCSASLLRSSLLFALAFPLLARLQPVTRSLLLLHHTRHFPSEPLAVAASTPSCLLSRKKEAGLLQLPPPRRLVLQVALLLLRLLVRIARRRWWWISRTESCSPSQQQHTQTGGNKRRHMEAQTNE